MYTFADKKGNSKLDCFKYLLLKLVDEESGEAN